MAEIKITMNGQQIGVPSGITVLEAAEYAGIHIPTLCHMKDIAPRANCRMCVVEIERFRTFQPACATKATDGMVIRTDTPAIRKARKLNLELILSHHAVDCHHCMRIGNSKCEDLDPSFCEMCFFCDCVKDGFCELQALAREYKVDLLPFEQEFCGQEPDVSSGVIIRNPNKCVKCRRCLDICNEVQSVHNLCTENRGTETRIVPQLGKSMAESSCTGCGRCVDVCPTGAIFALEHIDEVVYHAHKPGVLTVAQVSENILPELSKLFKMEGQAKLGIVISGLHKIGIDHVVAEKAAASLVIQQEKKLLEECLGENSNGPLIMTNSHAAQKFIKAEFPDMESKVHVYPSVQEQYGKLVQEAIGEGIRDRENLRVVNVTSQVENATEAHQDVRIDYVVNARELYRMFLRTGVDIRKRPIEEPDTFIEDVAEETPVFEPVSWSLSKDITYTKAQWKGRELLVAEAVNLGQTRAILEQVKAGSNTCDIIRIHA